ncbi:MAG: AMP phosphorylase [Candidatus Woesearchaeota archaeon]
MKLIVKDMDIATGGTQIVILNKADAEALDLHPMDRLLVRKGNKKTISVLDIAESEKAVPRGKIGLFEEVLDALGAVEGDIVQISFEKKPESVGYIKEKLDGKELSYDKIYEIVKDIVDNKLTDIELSSYITANYTRGMTTKEIVALTKAMIATGSVLKLKERPIVDLHSIGGVPGNRTTLIVVPILVAAGLKVPKTSSRAITSPAGTADTMEVFCNVMLPMKKLEQIVKKVGGFIVWGGSVNLAPADDRIIKVEYPLALDAEGQMLASILAKKLSVNATNLLVEIPVGKGAKVESLERALHLKHHFELLSKELWISTKVMITDGSQPVGRGIGPALEARDCLWVLMNDPRGPKDLKQKSIEMAGELLEFSGKVAKGKGKEFAATLLENGSAYKKFSEIISAQEGKLTLPDDILLGNNVYEVRSETKGIVKRIENAVVTKIARLAGAPIDKRAGLYLHKKSGESVSKGEILFTIYAESAEKLKYAVDVAKKMPAFVIE